MVSEDLCYSLAEDEYGLSKQPNAGENWKRITFDFFVNIRTLVFKRANVSFHVPFYAPPHVPFLKNEGALSNWFYCFI